MLDFAAVLKRIELNQMPFWKLYVKEGYNRSFVATNIDLENQTVESGSDILGQHVQMYGDMPQTVFYIEHYKVPSANGKSKTDPVPFVADAERYRNSGKGGMSGMDEQVPPVPPPASFQSQVESSLTGLGEVYRQQAGMFEERIKQERQWYTREMELNNKQKDLEAREERLKEKQLETKEMEKKYNSRSEIVSNGATRAIEGFLSSLSGKPVQAQPGVALAGSEGAVSEGAVSEGLETGGQAVGFVAPVSAPATPSEKVIQSVAQNVEENVSSLDWLRAWGLLTQQLIGNPAHPAFAPYLQAAGKLIWKSEGGGSSVAEDVQREG